MCHKKVYHWVKKVRKKCRQAGFSRHFCEALEIYSKGVARAKSSQIRKIATKVKGNRNSHRRRLQRFVGRETDRCAWFEVWTAIVLQKIRPKSKRLVLVVDEVKIEDRFGAMVVGLAYENRCIPLAWRIYKANDKASYPAEGQVKVIQQLLEAIKPAISKRCKVLVLADRGIGTSPDLMRVVIDLKWQFLFRVTKQSKIILADGQEITFHDQVTKPGQAYAAKGKVFKKRGRIPAHVRVLWGLEAKAPWALVTNDPDLSGWEYAQRMWIEEAFRDLKSHGWQLSQNRFTDPDRLANLWLLLVLAYTWLLFWGKAVEDQGLAEPKKRLPNGAFVRRLSLFTEGLYAFDQYFYPT